MGGSRVTEPVARSGIVQHCQKSSYIKVERRGKNENRLLMPTSPLELCCQQFTSFKEMSQGMELRCFVKTNRDRAFKHDAWGADIAHDRRL